MAADYHQPLSTVLPIRNRSAALLATEQVGAEVHNWRLREDGTLRTVRPPAELVPRYNSYSGGWFLYNDYGDPLGMLGVHHMRLDDRSSREIFLAHFNGAIWVFFGHQAHVSGAAWRQLIGPDGSAQVQTTLSVTGLRPCRHTQFISTPQGVVILVEGLRPYLYDGERVHPFGFMEVPSPPKPLHPQGSIGDGSPASSSVSAGSSASNSEGYSITGRTLPGALGTGRLGTLDTTVTAISDSANNRFKNPLGGAMLQTEHQFKSQWIDHLGNLGPLSEASPVAACAAEQNVEKSSSSLADERADRMRWQVLLTSIAQGPEGTAGRVIGMTKDLASAGDPRFYNVVTNLSGANFGFASIPDNDTEVMPFNISSDWLQVPMTEVLPMPMLSFGALAMGRFWGTAEGALYGSLPGRYGSLDPKMFILPDARGAKLTGLAAIAQGLLVFTSRSTYLVEPNDDGSGVRARTLHADVGTESPNSIQVHPSGVVFWRSGARTFHRYAEGQVTPLDLQDIADILAKVNRAWTPRSASALDPVSGAYRCWLALQGSKLNNICVEFDGAGWKTRDDIQAQAMCNLDSSEKLIAALGRVATVHPGTGAAGNADSLFAVDHAALWTREVELVGAQETYPAVEAPAPLEAVLETTWLRSTRSYRKGSPTRIFFWLNETASSGFTVEAMADNRTRPILQTLPATDARALSRFAESDAPAFYDAVVIGSTVTYEQARNARLQKLQAPVWMRTRRRYSAKVDVELPSVETFKIRLRVTGDANFVALAYQENTFPWHGGATVDTGEGT